MSDQDFRYISSAGNRKDFQPLILNPNSHPGYTPVKMNVKTANDLKLMKSKPPEKPMVPYMRYSRKVWDAVKTNNPEAKLWEIGKIVGNMWRDLNDYEKQEYINEYENAKAEYCEQIKNYHNSPQYQNFLSNASKKKDFKMTNGMNTNALMSSNIINTINNTNTNNRLSGMINSNNINSINSDVFSHYAIEPAEDDGIDDSLSIRHVASNRFNRNHRLLNEIFNEYTVADNRSIVTSQRMEQLKKQVSSLELHQEKLKQELQVIEEKYEIKKKKILDSSADFQNEIEKLNKFTITDEQLKSFYDKHYEVIEKQWKEHVERILGQSGTSILDSEIGLENLRNNLESLICNPKALTTPQLSSSISVIALHQISEPITSVANTAANTSQAQNQIHSNSNNVQTAAPNTTTNAAASAVSASVVVPVVTNNPNVVVGPHPNALINASQPMVINHNQYQGQQQQQPHQQASIPPQQQQHANIYNQHPQQQQQIIHGMPNQHQQHGMHLQQQQHQTQQVAGAVVAHHPAQQQQQQQQGNVVVPTMQQQHVQAPGMVAQNQHPSSMHHPVQQQQQPHMIMNPQGQTTSTEYVSYPNQMTHQGYQTVYAQPPGQTPVDPQQQQQMYANQMNYQSPQQQQYSIQQQQQQFQMQRSGSTGPSFMPQQGQGQGQQRLVNNPSQIQSPNPQQMMMQNQRPPVPQQPPQQPGVVVGPNQMPSVQQQQPPPQPQGGYQNFMAAGGQNQFNQQQQQFRSTNTPPINNPSNIVSPSQHLNVAVATSVSTTTPIVNAAANPNLVVQSQSPIVVNRIQPQQQPTQMMVQNNNAVVVNSRQPPGTPQQQPPPPSQQQQGSTAIPQQMNFYNPQMAQQQPHMYGMQQQQQHFRDPNMMNQQQQQQMNPYAPVQQTVIAGGQPQPTPLGTASPQQTVVVAGQPQQYGMTPQPIMMQQQQQQQQVPPNSQQMYAQHPQNMMYNTMPQQQQPQVNPMNPQQVIMMQQQIPGQQPQMINNQYAMYQNTQPMPMQHQQQPPQQQLQPGGQQQPQQQQQQPQQQQPSQPSTPQPTEQKTKGKKKQKTSKSGSANETS